MARLIRAPYALAVWARALRRRHIRVLFSHPHHYVTAAGITVLLMVAGHYEVGAVVAAWCYALVENVSTAADDIADELNAEHERATVLAYERPDELADAD